MVARQRGLIRPKDIETLPSNHQRQLPVRGTKDEIDHRPVVRLYLPFTGCCWLLSELESPDIAFGLCDLGVGFPELGSVWLPELEELCHPHGLRVLQDVDFRARSTIGEYARIAHQQGRIVT